VALPGIYNLRNHEIGSTMMKEPVTIYSISGPWKGQLAIVSRPRGGDWLDDEVRAWRESGLDVIVSLLTADESVRWELAEEAQLCQTCNMQFLGFAIEDHGVPKSQVDTFQLASKLNRALASGQNVAIHCWGGIGRSGMIAACVLVRGGIEPNEALQLVSTARGSTVPDTPQQREWVIEFARKAALPVR
jgi:protein-tyrosine phosphatase